MADFIRWRNFRNICRIYSYFFGIRKRVHKKGMHVPCPLIFYQEVYPRFPGETGYTHIAIMIGQKIGQKKIKNYFYPMLSGNFTDNVEGSIVIKG